MEKEMRELYIEGVAIHGGPESCVGVPRGRSEALIGVRAGWASEPRNVVEDRGADAFVTGGRQHRWRRYRESSADPARSRNLGTHGVSMRENREIPRSPVLWSGAGREGNAEAVSP
jgi:hypothetical protein